MTSVRRALAFAFTERYLIIGMQVASFALVARLLTPEQIGLYSVSLALVGIAQVVRDFGISSFLVQRETLTNDTIASAFGLALVLGIALFALVMSIASPIGVFYSDSNLAGIIRLVAFNFLLLPFNSVSIALLRREMRFETLMRLNVSGAAVSTTVVLVLAWAGFGSWSLAWGEIASNVCIAAGVWSARRASGLPGPRLREWRLIVSFGGQITLSNIVTSISMDINDLVVGKILGFPQVAILSRAQGLMNLFHRDFMGAVRGVAFPAYAKAHREGQSVEASYIASVAVVTGMAWPFYGFAALFPLEILRIVFGPQWDSAAQFVPFFCLAGAFAAVVSLIPSAMMAIGQTNLIARADLIIQPVKAGLLTFLVMYHKALFPFAVGFLAISILAVPYFYAFKQKCLPTDFGLLGRSLARSAGVAALSLAPASLMALVLRDEHGALGVLAFLACLAATGVSWVLSLWGLGHPLFGEGRRIYSRLTG